MNSDLQKIFAYFSANSLQANASKTNYMIIHPTRDYNGHTPLTINNTNIKQITECTFLGITIDNKLTFQSHIKRLTNKVSSGLFALRQVKNILPRRHLKPIYHALIASHLNHGITFWNSATKTNTHKLLVLQKKALRIITHSDYNAPSTPLFNSEKILTIDNLHRLQLYRLMYRINHNHLPTGIRTLFSQNTTPPNRTYNTRYRETNPMPARTPRHSLTQRSLVFQGPSLWNALSLETKQITTLKHFINRQKTYLINTQHP